MVVATFDLSTELGVSGKFDAPVLLDAVRHAERAILNAGIASVPLHSRANRRSPTSAAGIASWCTGSMC